ncbi:MAG: hypothetical protein NHB15_13200 [Methanosarcina barkeri]|nr:hypothetical protein [Methanosarcina sp. ERenArc_MAG2]
MEDNLIYGFLGGIIGGICVNIVSIEYQKLRDKKEKEKISQKENQRKIIEKLKEIEFSLENAISESPKYKQIQNDCLIFSNQLTSILSQTIEDVPEETIDDLKRLNSDLTRLGNFPLHLGYDFPSDCILIIESAQEIIRKIENYSNN